MRKNLVCLGAIIITLCFAACQNTSTIQSSFKDSVGTVSECTQSNVPTTEKASNGLSTAPSTEVTSNNEFGATTDAISSESQPETTSSLDSFIISYNKIAPTPITDTEEININDKSSNHYRTEFRLGAFSDADAKTGKIGDASVDIVSYGWDKSSIRVYSIGTFTQIKEIIWYASLVLDSTLSEDDLQSVMTYLDENKSANGYYYGDIGMVLLELSENNYDLMLKSE